MKKSSKIILTLLALIVVVYGIFVFADSKRLEKADKGTKPIITISEDKENHSFMGLGYNVKYYLNEGETEYKNAYGAECRLFGKILLWAYVEDKHEGEKETTKSDAEQNAVKKAVTVSQTEGDTKAIGLNEADSKEVKKLIEKCKFEVNPIDNMNDAVITIDAKDYCYDSANGIFTFSDKNTPINEEKTAALNEEERVALNSLLSEYIVLGSQDEPKWAYPPMVMVNDELYLDTGHTNNEAKCGVMDGEISSSVEAYERPTENDQSNFGKGYGYQLGAEEGTIEVLIDGKWVIYATEEKRAEIQNVNN